MRKKRNVKQDNIVRITDRVRVTQGRYEGTEGWVIIVWETTATIEGDKWWSDNIGVPIEYLEKL
jgi:ribosomal protein L24